MDGSMYALAGNVKARARSSPALIDRSSVTDTRRSLASANPRRLPLIGDYRHIGPAIVDRMLATDQVEGDRNRQNHTGGDEDGDLVGAAVDADTANRHGLGDFVGEEVRPKREDRRGDHVGLAQQHGNPNADHSAANPVWAACIRVFASQHDDRGKHQDVGEGRGRDHESKDDGEEVLQAATGDQEVRDQEEAGQDARDDIHRHRRAEPARKVSEAARTRALQGPDRHQAVRTHQPYGTAGQQREDDRDPDDPVENVRGPPTQRIARDRRVADYEASDVLDVLAAEHEDDPDDRHRIAERADNAGEGDGPGDIPLRVIKFFAGIARNLESDPLEHEDADDADEGNPQTIEHAAQAALESVLTPRNHDEHGKETKETELDKGTEVGHPFHRAQRKDVHHT